MIKPRKQAEVSPIKILALGKFQGKNPKHIKPNPRLRKSKNGISNVTSMKDKPKKVVID